jgi:hypothetical protein
MLDFVKANFPRVKLSYASSHNKVCDLRIKMPVGDKCFAWFTSFSKNNVCFLINEKMDDVKLMNCCFSTELAYGTVLYGTRFINNGATFFAMEDVLLYKGTNVDRYNWGHKFKLMTEMMKCDIRQISYNRNFVVFGLPLIAEPNETTNVQLYNYNEIGIYRKAIIEKPIVVTNVTKTEILTKPVVNTKPKIQRFVVKPDLQNDVYHLFQDGKLIGTAGIPDYKTSVHMNKLFRSIKENTNLDALEESDDEAEFENEQLDKFVDLEKSVAMNCFYHTKFKKWCPSI